jgi:DNA gyrase subunit A
MIDGKYLLLLNKRSYKEGRMVYTPIGGALEYLPKAKGFLDNLGAKYERETPDLRFKMDSENLDLFKFWFEKGIDRERDVVRELTEEMIEEENIVVSLTKDGYIKRVPLDTFKAQGRGGKGVIAVKGREEDEASSIFPGSTHDLFLFFTNKGNLLKKKGYEIPIASRTSKGIHTANLLALAPDEKVSSFLNLRTLDVDGYFVMATKNGLIKRSEIREYDTSLRKRGLKAISLNDNDELLHVSVTDGNKDIMLVTANGFAVRYGENAVTSIGRVGKGVRSMNLQEEDSIVSMLVLKNDESSEILVITENGFGKKTNSDEYKSLSGRYAKGSRTINTEKKSRNGQIICAAVVNEGKDFLVLTQKGKMIRMSVEDLRSKGKTTTGSKIVGLDNGDKVQTLVVVDKSISKDSDI